MIRFVVASSAVFFGICMAVLVLAAPTGGLPGDSMSEADLLAVRGEANYLTCLAANPAVACTGPAGPCAQPNNNAVCVDAGGSCGGCSGSNNRSCLIGGDAIHCTAAPLAFCCTEVNTCRDRPPAAGIAHGCACNNTFPGPNKVHTTRTNC